MNPTSPRIGSLCTGYGGLDQGVQSVYGGETVWVSDIDKGANQILAHRYPDARNLGDFTQTDWATVEPIDILTAGFPCQPVSNAGKRLGDLDERWLWDDVARAVGELRPGIVVLENVRGLLTAGSGRLFGRVLGALANLGYDAQWHGLRAADIGAPHGRWRVFITATDTHRAGRSQRRRPIPVRAEHTAAEHVRKDAVSLLPTPAVNDMGAGKTVGDWDAWTERMKVEHGNGNGHGKSLAIEAQRLLPTPTSANAADGANLEDWEEARLALVEKGYNGNGRGTPLAVAVRQDQWGDYAAAIARWEQILGREAPAPTQTSSKGSPQLSPAFVEWMMGLPAGWVTDVPGITRNQALKALGNGVVPQQAAAALRTMLAWDVAA